MANMTIRDVAKTAAVSVSTVSLALRGDPRIAEQTRSLVERTAKRLNYQRRAPGRPPRGAHEAPGTRRTNRVALLVPGIPRGVLNSPVYMDVLHGVESALAEANRVCVLRHLLPDAPAPATLFPQKVDGVVLFGATKDSDLRGQLSRLPCVEMMGVVMPNLPWDQVTYDNDAIGRLAGEYLLGRGHRVVAMLASDSDSVKPVTADLIGGRREGFRRTVKEAEASLHLVYDDPLFALKSTHQEAVLATLERIVDQLLAADPRPTGLFCPQDLLTVGLQPLLQARGIVLGRDLELVSCNNEALLLQGLHPRPATVDIHACGVGRQAVERLLWRLEHPAAPRATTILQPTLVLVSSE